MEHRIPTPEEFKKSLVESRNWGRWGPDDERGAVNLITADKIVAATHAVRSGRKISLSRPLPTSPSPNNPTPAIHNFVRTDEVFGPGSGFFGEWITVKTHDASRTHIDALCHIWDEDGMYNGRSPDENGFDGARFGGLQHWADGIVTRGVMLDVPRFRGTPFVPWEEPVHGWELEGILQEREISLEPGDAVCVYSGREAWQLAHPDRPYGRWIGPSGRIESPGLHASCVKFLHDHDVSMLIWDMYDWVGDHDYHFGMPVHTAIFTYGIAVIDSALLEPLASACVAEDQDEFLIIAAPLHIPQGTGSLINPIAIL